MELKTSVFKKFDRNNLFQLSCSDCRERFHYMILLFVVCVRNLNQFDWDMSQFGPLVDFIVVFFVIEFFIDWIKHGFILKFNELSTEVYREYIMSLAHDMVKTKQDIVSHHVFSSTMNRDDNSALLVFARLSLTTQIYSVVVWDLFHCPFPV